MSKLSLVHMQTVFIPGEAGCSTWNTHGNMAGQRGKTATDMANIPPSIAHCRRCREIARFCFSGITHYRPPQSIVEGNKWKSVWTSTDNPRVL